MSDTTVNQFTFAIYYFLAGICFSILFDIFSITQKIFKNPKWLILLEDTVFWIIFIIVVFIMNFNILNGSFLIFSVLAIISGAVLYIIIRIFLKKKFFKR